MNSLRLLAKRVRLPLEEIISFIAMKYAGVDSHIMSLSGIAIAIGTMVDMAVIVSENILRRLREAAGTESVRAIVLGATTEVGGAVVTAISTSLTRMLHLILCGVGSVKPIDPTITMVPFEGAVIC